MSLSYFNVFHSFSQVRTPAASASKQVTTRPRALQALEVARAWMIGHVQTNYMKNMKPEPSSPREALKPYILLFRLLIQPQQGPLPALRTNAARQSVPAGAAAERDASEKAKSPSPTARVRQRAGSSLGIGSENPRWTVDRAA